MSNKISIDTTFDFPYSERMLKAVTIQGKLVKHTVGTTDAEAIARYLNRFIPFQLPVDWDNKTWYDIAGQALWAKVQSAYQAELVSVDIEVIS